jgi:hypothetical protein
MDAKRLGRPPMGKQPRQRINTTVDPDTLRKIHEDRQPGESLGAVLDRWALRYA